jgi:hypothetical protein
MENISILKKEHEMNKSVLIAFITVIAIMISLGCASAIRYDGPYEGRVIDAYTGEPIEGVVVLGVWNKEHITPGGAVSEYYDARETVTDKKGEFSIPGQGLLIASNVTPMNVLIFKAGYEYLQTTWLGLTVDGILKQKIKWEGKKAIIPLRKLTMEERKKAGTFPSTPPSKAPLDKVRLILKEINKEAIERGLETIDIWRGENVWEK